MGSAGGKKSSPYNKIVVAPYGSVDLEQFRDSFEAAALIYGLDPYISNGPLLLSDEISRLERQRKQREARALISSFKNALRRIEEKWALALIVTNYDLFVKNTNFVFGLASAEERIAVLSTARLTLWEEGITPSRIKERILKEAAHEIGHLARLAHCPNQTCLMSYAESVDRVDEKLPILCESCRKSSRTNGR
jgi:archaemetzincin